jgi:hypothetical protein
VLRIIKSYAIKQQNNRIKNDAFFTAMAAKMGYTDATNDNYPEIFQNIFKKYMQINADGKYHNVRERKIVDEINIMIGSSPLIINDMKLVVLYNLFNIADVKNDVFENFKNLVIASHLLKYPKGFDEIADYVKQYIPLLHVAMVYICDGIIHKVAVKGYSDYGDDKMLVYRCDFSGHLKDVLESNPPSEVLTV